MCLSGLSTMEFRHPSYWRRISDCTSTRHCSSDSICSGGIQVCLSRLGRICPYQPSRISCGASQFLGCSKPNVCYGSNHRRSVQNTSSILSDKCQRYSDTQHPFLVLYLENFLASFITFVLYHGRIHVDCSHAHGI